MWATQCLYTCKYCDTFGLTSDKSAIKKHLEANHKRELTSDLYVLKRKVQCKICQKWMTHDPLSIR